MNNLQQTMADWKAKYVRRLVDRGVTPDLALATFNAADDHEYDSDPMDAADEELSYWTQDDYLEEAP